MRNLCETGTQNHGSRSNVSEVGGLPKGDVMRKVTILLLIGLFQVGLLAGLAGAGTLVFSDDFDSFDTNRWSKGAHNLGRSYLDPNNVDVADGNLTIKLPANTLNGGEIASNDLYGYGSYSARIKV